MIAKGDQKGGSGAERNSLGVMRKTVQHEHYKGTYVRSNPSEFPTQGQTKWKVRLNITFPADKTISFTQEYRNHPRVFATSSEAHLAGLEWGHRIVDLWRESGQIPSVKLAVGLLWP